MNAIDQVFFDIDKDGSGTLDKSEVRVMFNAKNIKMSGAPAAIPKGPALPPAACRLPPPMLSGSLAPACRLFSLIILLSLCICISSMPRGVHAPAAQLRVD